MLKSRCVSNLCPNRCTITCRTLYLTSSFNFYEGHAYSITIDKGSQTAFIDSSWTRGLVVHPVGEFFSRILIFPFYHLLIFFSPTCSYHCHILRVLLRAICNHTSHGHYLVIGGTFGGSLDSDSIRPRYCAIWAR